MGFGEILPTASIAAQAALKRALRLGALAALALGFAPGRAAAQSTKITACLATPVTGSVTLDGDLTPDNTWTGPCITVGADNVTVNMKTFKIDMSAVGDAGVAIDAGAYNNTTIDGNGVIVTNYTTAAADSTAAIQATGGSNLNISGLTIENQPNGSACGMKDNSDPNQGNGIMIDAVTGGTIGPNTVTCFQTGIKVRNSAVPRQGTGIISGNTLNWDTYYMGGASSETYSGGLVLDNSSGWAVSNNKITYTGSVSPNYDCTPTGTVLTCAFGLQIINASSDNDITGNTVSNNFVGGIMTGSDTAKNSITSNVVQYNGLYDLYEVGRGHGNKFQNNTCLTVGGSLSQRTCQ